MARPTGVICHITAEFSLFQAVSIRPEQHIPSTSVGWFCPKHCEVTAVRKPEATARVITRHTAQQLFCLLSGQYSPGSSVLSYLLGCCCGLLSALKVQVSHCALHHIPWKREGYAQESQHSSSQYSGLWVGRFTNQWGKKSYPIDSIFIVFNIDVYKGEKTPSGLLQKITGLSICLHKPTQNFSARRLNFGIQLHRLFKVMAKI